MEAARALGFSYPAAMRLVVVPQGVRRVLPALVNQFIALLKASALVYFLGLVADQRELFQVGRDLNAQTGNLSPLVAAGLFYLSLTVPLTHLVNHIDTRLRRGRAPSEPAADTGMAFDQEMTWSPPRRAARRCRWRPGAFTRPSAGWRCCAASTSTFPRAARRLWSDRPGRVSRRCCAA